MVKIQEQQQQLIRLQQAAKNQLFEMEQLRNQQQPLSFANNQNAPDYDNVEDVAQDVTQLMTRMKTLTDFIHNQNDLASSLGIEDKTELMEEQQQLQKKLMDLKNKKQQMANLVNELHAMNAHAENSFDDSNRSTATPPRNMNEESFDRIPIERLEHNGKVGDQPSHSNASINDEEVEDDDEVAAAAGSLLQDKISQINAMKDQLKRLQDMMHTVKLIEIKNGDYQPEDDFNEKSQDEPNNESNDDPQRDDEEQVMAERVRVLHSMTNDLREQAGQFWKKDYFFIRMNN